MLPRYPDEAERPHADRAADSTLRGSETILLVEDESAFRQLTARMLERVGYTADVIAQHGGLEAGVSFLPKPFSVDAVAAKVRETLDRE
jgi:DNA-binding response OmpR family regulator